jgi:hypothetical protein
MITAIPPPIQIINGNELVSFVDDGEVKGRDMLNNADD